MTLCLSLIAVSAQATTEATTVICGVEMNTLNVSEGSPSSGAHEVLQDYKNERKCARLNVCLIQGGLAVTCDALSTDKSEAIYWKIK